MIIDRERKEMNYSFFAFLFSSSSLVFCFFLTQEKIVSNLYQGCIKSSIPPPTGGGNKIKGFGDGEENQRVVKRKNKVSEDFTLLTVSIDSI